jgi:hypothetical protein
MIDSEPRYAVIDRSEGEPTLYHLAPTAARAETLRARREATTGVPCFVVPLDAWRSDPLGALRAAEAARFG